VSLGFPDPVEEFEDRYYRENQRTRSALVFNGHPARVRPTMMCWSYDAYHSKQDDPARYHGSTRSTACFHDDDTSLSPLRESLEVPRA
jgi:hypothetical protein